MRASLFLVTLASVVTAFTPPQFQPSSSANLTVAFGSVPANNGVVLPRDATASPPQLYTDQPLNGTYALLLVDPDIPATDSSGITSTLLHWLQPGLSSSSVTVTVAGRTVYPLINPANISAYAAYLQPNPPYRVPYSHRYVELLLDTTSTPNNSVLASAANNRTAFNQGAVLAAARVGVVAGNWFNVTNTQFLANGSAPVTVSTTLLTATATGMTTTTTTRPSTVTTSIASALRLEGAMLALYAGVAALAALML